MEQEAELQRLRDENADLKKRIAVKWCVQSQDPSSPLNNNVGRYYLHLHCDFSHWNMNNGPCMVITSCFAEYK